MLRQSFVLIGVCAMLSGCVSSGQFKEAKDNQQNLQAQLAQAQRERDDWKGRYDQLAVSSDALNQRAVTAEKKLADVNAQLTARQADLDASNAKLSETAAQAAKFQTDLTAAQRDQMALKQMQQRVAEAEKANAEAQQALTSLKSQIAAQNASARQAAEQPTQTTPAAGQNNSTPAAPAK